MSFLLITALLLGNPSVPSARMLSSVETSKDDTLRTVLDTAQTPLKMPTDTGRMVWGRDDFSRYDAQACDRAFMSEWRLLRRTRTQDTVFRKLEYDTLPQHVTDIARSCGNQFTATNTPGVQLWSLLRIALATQRDDEIPAIVARNVGLAQTVSEKAQTLLTAIETLIGARPARLTIAQALLQQLDSLGSEVQLYQFRGRGLLLRYWFNRYVRDSIMQQAESMLSRYHAMEQKDKDEVIVLEAYMALLNLAELEGDMAKQDSILDRALQDLGSWRSGTATTWISALSSMQDLKKQLLNRPTRPLDGTFWFNHNGTPQPAPGKMSLLVHVNHTRGEFLVQLYTLLRQLHERYGDALVITLITETHGYTVGSGPLEPADEAKQVASYFLNFLKLPVVVLVDNAPYQTLPDGRRRYLMSPVGETFGGWQMFNAVLTDRSGKIQWLGDLGAADDEAKFVALMDRLER